jgi:hypothetical protein
MPVGVDLEWTAHRCVGNSAKHHGCRVIKSINVVPRGGSIAWSCILVNDITSSSIRLRNDCQYSSDVCNGEDKQAGDKTARLALQCCVEVYSLAQNRETSTSQPPNRTMEFGSRASRAANRYSPRCSRLSRPRWSQKNWWQPKRYHQSRDSPEPLTRRRSSLPTR